jgi:hypothetical protein
LLIPAKELEFLFSITDEAARLKNTRLRRDFILNEEVK